MSFPVAVYMGSTNDDALGWEIGKLGQRDYTRKVRVDCDTQPVNDTKTKAVIEAALVAAGINLGSPSLDRAGALCTGAKCISVKRFNGSHRKMGWNPFWRTIWNVTYSTKLDNQPPKDQSDPLKQPPIITFECQQYQTAAYVGNLTDVDGTPVPAIAVTNSVGDSIPREKRRSRIIVSISRNVASFNWSLLAEGDAGGYLFSRNLAPWDPTGGHAVLGNPGLTTTRVPSGKALCVQLNANYAYDNGKEYVKLSGRFEIDQVDSHQDIFIDQGYFHFDDLLNKNLVRFIDSTGYPSSPQMLDGSGLAYFGTEPVTRKYQYYGAKDWGNFPLPGSPIT